jgi:hypothetical protein
MSLSIPRFPPAQQPFNGPVLPQCPRPASVSAHGGQVSESYPRSCKLTTVAWPLLRPMSIIQTNPSRTNFVRTMPIRHFGRPWDRRLFGFTIVSMIAVAFQYYHLPLLMQFDDWNRAFPVTSATEQLQTRAFIGNGTQVDFLRTEKLVVEWHETLWKYRSDLITQIPLVDMDDEEDFELELGVKDSKPLKNRSSWLTAHLFIHILLIAWSHTDRQSKLIPVTALISQAILIILFMQAKRLDDNVSNAVSVVRRASRIFGTQVIHPFHQ